VQAGGRHDSPEEYGRSGAAPHRPATGKTALALGISQELVSKVGASGTCLLVALRKIIFLRRSCTAKHLSIYFPYL
jgi:hypothetical protein